MIHLYVQATPILSSDFHLRVGVYFYNPNTGMQVSEKEYLKEIHHKQAPYLFKKLIEQYPEAELHRDRIMIIPLEESYKETLLKVKSLITEER